MLFRSLLGELQTKAKTAINSLCDEVIELLDGYRVKRDDSIEAVVDYKTYLAIQYGVKARYGSEEDKENSITKALQLYEEALKIANEHLNPAHPIRLNVAINYSLFCYYKLDSVDKTLAVAEEAFFVFPKCLMK